MASPAESGHQSIDYERHGHGYARRRRPDPTIAARIHAALGDARTVVNVGAGAGSYEPEDRHDDDRRRFPGVARIAGLLGGARVESVPNPADCADGFFEAYWARPEAYLDQAVRSAQSIWPRLPPGVEQRAIRSLEADLTSGAWDVRHGHLRSEPGYDGLLVLVISQP
jgi:hypothetical protein